MNNFGGRINGFSSVLIDKFDCSYNAFSRTSHLFLSHCHSDHMVGLDDEKFAKNIQSRKVYLYCSVITKKILINNDRYKHLASYVKTLEINDPTTFSAQECQIKDFIVTLLPAGHCPGSVMFLFEGHETNVLYTGDFRVPVDILSKYEHLHSNNRVKKLDYIYTDTTFCIAEAFYIPTQEESIAAIVDIVHSWLNDKNENNCVRLICSAKIGYECIFISLHDKFKMKVHVGHSSASLYKGIEDLEKCVTASHDTRIYAGYKKDWFPIQSNSGSPLTSDEILTIKLSAMWYAQHKSINEIIFQSTTYPNYYRACFSMHSSLSEIQQFIDYLKPKQVIPLVIPSSSSLDVVLKLIRQTEQLGSAYGNNCLGYLKHKFEEDSSFTSDDLSFNASITPKKRSRLSESLKSNSASQNCTGSSLKWEYPNSASCTSIEAEQNQAVDVIKNFGKLSPNLFSSNDSNGSESCDSADEEQRNSNLISEVDLTRSSDSDDDLTPSLDCVDNNQSEIPVENKYCRETYADEDGDDIMVITLSP